MLEVCTGARLHFGLMELAAGEKLRFGGMGLMLEQPQWRLVFSDQPSAADDTIPSLQVDDQEIHSRIQRVLTAGRSSQNSAVTTRECLPLHSGLGAGTQLAAATATGVLLLEGLARGTIHAGRNWTTVTSSLPELNAACLAKFSGRGLRSAIGLHGFLHGGLILDEGYEPSATGRKVVTRGSVLPEEWRVVLVRPVKEKSVSGEEEVHLLSKIARTRNPHAEEMYDLAHRTLVYLAEKASIACPENAALFEQVMTWMEEYMLLAARLFEKQQGGLYNGSAIAGAVAAARGIGLRSVGQSSWGPTVFGFSRNSNQAHAAAVDLLGRHPSWQVTVAKPAASGARWRLLDSRGN